MPCFALWEKQHWLLEKKRFFYKFYKNIKKIINYKIYKNEKMKKWAQAIKEDAKWSNFVINLYHIPLQIMMVLFSISYLSLKYRNKLFLILIEKKRSLKQLMERIARISRKSIFF